MSRDEREGAFRGEGAMSPPGMLPPASSGPEGMRRGRGSSWYVWVIGGCLGTLAVLVVGCALISGAVGGLLVRLANMREADASFAQTYTVAGRPQITVEDFAGTVTVAAGKAGAVQVTGTKRARAETDNVAQSGLSGITVTMQQQGNAITVRASASGNAGASRSVDLTLTVPVEADLNLRLAAGDVEISGVSGALTVAAEAGNVELRQVTAMGTSQVSASAGDVTFDGALADEAALTLTVGNGDVSVTLPPGTATHVQGQTRAGDVSVAGWPLATARNGAAASVSGDTRTNPTSALTVTVSSGDISLHAAD
ncbi:MAG: hypothetical protein OJF49_002032 [Ktedonobacterales bacterium]|jgi:hypothetical protein|nr:MAG: hypothetical protein OJF49_002032 [Ktedonobacterales bacterium]